MSFDDLNSKISKFPLNELEELEQIFMRQAKELTKSQLEEQKIRKMFDSSQIELQRLKSSNDEILRLLNQEQSIQKTMIDYSDSYFETNKRFESFKQESQEQIEKLKSNVEQLTLERIKFAKELELLKSDNAAKNEKTNKMESDQLEMSKQFSDLKSNERKANQQITQLKSEIDEKERQFRETLHRNRLQYEQHLLQVTQQSQSKQNNEDLNQTWRKKLQLVQQEHNKIEEELRKRIEILEQEQINSKQQKPTPISKFQQTQNHQQQPTSNLLGKRNSSQFESSNQHQQQQQPPPQSQQTNLQTNNNSKIMETIPGRKKLQRLSTIQQQQQTPNQLSITTTTTANYNQNSNQYQHKSTSFNNNHNNEEFEDLT